MDQETDKTLRALLELGVPRDVLQYLLASAEYLEILGGPTLSTYWNPGQGDLLIRQRDEFFLVGNAALWILNLIRKVPCQNEWRLEFDCAYLFQAKSLAQACRSIDLLCGARCYADALTVVRALHSRVNLLLLFSLAPHLFNEWLRSPRHEKFLDSHVRNELANHRVRVFPHLYEQFSEIIHGQFRALAEVGHLEKGLFPAIVPIGNMVLVGAKFLLGIAGWAGLSMIAEDQLVSDTHFRSDELEGTKSLFAFLTDRILIPSRSDHLWTMMAEDRHWKQIGKDKFLLGEWFDFGEYRHQLTLFHRTAQPKTLGKGYRR